MEQWGTIAQPILLRQPNQGWDNPQMETASLQTRVIYGKVSWTEKTCDTCSVPHGSHLIWWEKEHVVWWEKEHVAWNFACFRHSTVRGFLKSPRLFTAILHWNKYGDCVPMKLGAVSAKATHLCLAAFTVEQLRPMAFNPRLTIHLKAQCTASPAISVLYTSTVYITNSMQSWSQLVLFFLSQATYTWFSPRISSLPTCYSWSVPPLSQDWQYYKYNYGWLINA